MQDKNKVLQRELEQIRAQVAALESTVEDKPDYGLGTGASGTTRWELDRAMLRRLKERAVSLEQALSQAGEDAYGICIQCGRSIHPDRLSVLPDTRVCIRCAWGDEHNSSMLQPDVLEVEFQS
jgi:DnaK suppressor protein